MDIVVSSLDEQRMELILKEKIFGYSLRGKNKRISLRIELDPKLLGITD